MLVNTTSSVLSSEKIPPGRSRDLHPLHYSPSQTNIPKLCTLNKILPATSCLNQKKSTHQEFTELNTILLEKILSTESCPRCLVFCALPGIRTGKSPKREETGNGLLPWAPCTQTLFVTDLVTEGNGFGVLVCSLKQFRSCLLLHFPYNFAAASPKTDQIRATKDCFALFGFRGQSRNPNASCRHLRLMMFVFRWLKFCSQFLSNPLSCQRQCSKNTHCFPLFFCSQNVSKI